MPNLYLEITHPRSSPQPKLPLRSTQKHSDATRQEAEHGSRGPLPGQSRAKISALCRASQPDGQRFEGKLFLNVAALETVQFGDHVGRSLDPRKRNAR
jgi:hypothetical protein